MDFPAEYAEKLAQTPGQNQVEGQLRYSDGLEKVHNKSRSRSLDGLSSPVKSTLNWRR